MTHHQQHPHNQPQHLEPQRPQYDPGETYGIVGLVMLVIGLPFIGIFLSIHGYRKSKKAGFHNSLAQVGIWLNAIFLIVVAALIVGVIALFKWGSSAIDKELQEAKSSAAIASQVEQFVNGYAKDGSYPDYATILKEYGSSKLVNAKPEQGQVGYEECRTANGEISGVKLHFYDTSSSDLEDWETQVRDETKIIGTCAASSDSWYTST